MIDDRPPIARPTLNTRRPKYDIFSYLTLGSMNMLHNFSCCLHRFFTQNCLLEQSHCNSGLVTIVIRNAINDKLFSLFSPRTLTHCREYVLYNLILSYNWSICQDDKDCWNVMSSQGFLEYLAKCGC